MRRRYDLTETEKAEHYKSACDNLTEDLVRTCSDFVKQAAACGYTITEINQHIRNELEDVKDAFK